jgi:hypothetical protein
MLFYYNNIINYALSVILTGYFSSPKLVMKDRLPHKAQ